MAHPICIDVYCEYPVEDLFDDDLRDKRYDKVLDIVSDYLGQVNGYDEDDDEYEEEYDETTLLNGMPMLTHITQPAYIQALEDWGALKGLTLKEMIRGYASDGQDGFWMVHGYGYDWVSSDILGGSSDGRAKQEFDAWVRENYNAWFDLVRARSYMDD